MSTYHATHEKVMQSRLGAQAGLKGLKNLGNTCFMNAALQSLSNTVPLTDYFLGHDWRSELNTGNFLGHGGRLAEAYGALLDELWTHSGDSSGAPFAPKQFKRVLSSCNEMFDGYEQHDTQELLTFLLDGLHEDLNRVKHRPVVDQVNNQGHAIAVRLIVVIRWRLTVCYSDDERDEEAVACEAWLGYLQRNRSIIVDLFQGQLRSVLLCKACGHKAVTFDPFMYLSVPVRASARATSVGECIDHFCDEEMLDDYSCTKCKKSKCVTKRLALWKLPPLLIIHLKRFAFNSSERASKIATPVRFPLENLDLSEMCPSYQVTMASIVHRSPLSRGDHGLQPFYAMRQRDRPVFDCCAFICHHGGFGSGHCTSTCRNRTRPDRWFHYDDARVAERSDAEVRPRRVVRPAHRQTADAGGGLLSGARRLGGVRPLLCAGRRVGGEGERPHSNRAQTNDQHA
jgi:ubiquitin C-terminal hydrolase